MRVNSLQLLLSYQCLIPIGPQDCIYVKTSPIGHLVSVTMPGRFLWLYQYYIFFGGLGSKLMFLTVTLFLSPEIGGHAIIIWRMKICKIYPIECFITSKQNTNKLKILFTAIVRFSNFPLSSKWMQVCSLYKLLCFSPHYFEFCSD